jgi:hypothetical protein
MADTPKILGQVAPSATTLTTVYTVPVTVGSYSTISTVTVCNRGDAGSFRIAVIRASETIEDKHYLYYNLPINANDTFAATIGITLSEQDVIQVYASHGNMSFVVFGVEYVPTAAEVPTAVVLSGFREVLTANRTYYVRTDGNDNNTGLVNDSTGAFLTLQKAINVVCKLIDNGGYNVTIQLADGTYTTSSPPILQDYVGDGSVKIIGNSTTPDNCNLAASSGSMLVNHGSKTWWIEGIDFSSATSNNGVFTDSGNLIFWNCRFGPCSGGAQIVAWFSATVQMGGTITCYGTSVYFQAAIQGAHIRSAYGDYATIAMSTPTYTGAVYYTDNGSLSPVSYQSGSATGKRFQADRLGMINTGGNGATYLPGTVAGTTSLGGQYG